MAGTRLRTSAKESHLKYLVQSVRKLLVLCLRNDLKLCVSV